MPTTCYMLFFHGASFQPSIWTKESKNSPSINFIGCGIAEQLSELGVASLLFNTTTFRDKDSLLAIADSFCSDSKLPRVLLTHSAGGHHGFPLLLARHFDLWISCAAYGTDIAHGKQAVNTNMHVLCLTGKNDSHLQGVWHGQQPLPCLGQASVRTHLIPHGGHAPFAVKNVNDRVQLDVRQKWMEQVQTAVTDTIQRQASQGQASTQ